MVLALIAILFVSPRSYLLFLHDHICYFTASKSNFCVNTPLNCIPQRRSRFETFLESFERKMYCGAGSLIRPDVFDLPTVCELQIMMWTNFFLPIVLVCSAYFFPPCRYTPFPSFFFLLSNFEYDSTLRSYWNFDKAINPSAQRELLSFINITRRGFPSIIPLPYYLVKRMFAER